MNALSKLVTIGILCASAMAWAQAPGAKAGVGAAQSKQAQTKAAVSQQSAPKPAAPKPVGTAVAPAPPAPSAAMPPIASLPATSPPAASLPATAAPPRSAPATPGGPELVVRLRELQARVDELKEQIRRSHARLSLLSDTILSGGINAARAEIKFQNEMSAAFRVTRVRVLLDGAVQYEKADEGESLATQRQIPVFQGTIAPGDHTLQVSVKLRGHGYGVFSYLRGYSFDLKDELTFTIDEGKTIQVAATAWEKGGTTTALEERPALRFTSKVLTGIEQQAQKAKVIKESKPVAPAVGPGAR